MSVAEAVNILHRTAVFGGLSDDRLNILAFSGERRKFTPGDEIANAGDEPARCIVVLEGRVVMHDPAGQQSDRSVGRGSTLGEISLITNQPLGFSVVGESGGEVLVITRPLFERMLGDFPDIAHHLHDAMRVRLGRTLRQLSSLEQRLRPADGDEGQILPQPERDQTDDPSPALRQLP